MWPTLKIFTLYRKGYSPSTSRGEAETRVARWGWWTGEQILPRPQEVLLHLLCRGQQRRGQWPLALEVEKATSAKWSLCFAELGTGWNCSYFSVSGICVGEQNLKRESVDKMIRKLVGKRTLQRIAKRSLEKKQRKTRAMTDTPPGMWDYNISCHFPRRCLRQRPTVINPILELRKLSPEMTKALQGRQIQLHL